MDARGCGLDLPGEGRIRLDARPGKTTMIDTFATASGDRGRPLVDSLREGARPWQGHPSAQLLAALAALIPMAAIVLWIYVLSESPLTIAGLLLWPLLAGGCFILWLLFLHVLVCGDSLESLGLLQRRPWLDLLLGAAGSLVLLVVKIGFQATLARLFPPPRPAEEIVELVSGLRQNPWLLALWLGPVVWVGVAGFEELWRAFMLRRLWRAWGGRVGRWASLVVVSALFGIAHSYQGPAAVVEIGLVSVLMGWVFMVTGRLRTLIVAHALYDSIQIAFLLIVIRQAMP
jgi:membrane protease YdiL (CAAX protease family)